MKVKLDCPNAYHGEYMRVFCKKRNGDICLFQHYKNCKGWWVNSPMASGCLFRQSKEKDQT